MGALLKPSNSVDMSLLGDGSVTIVPFKPVAVVQGTWTSGVTAVHLLSHQFVNSTMDDLDECNFKVMLAQGTYTLQVPAYAAGNRGIKKIYLDAVLIATFDSYAGVNAVVIHEQTGIVVSAGKLYTLTLKIDGKNAASSDYEGNVSAFNFIKTA